MLRPCASNDRNIVSVRRQVQHWAFQPLANKGIVRHLQITLDYLN